MRREKDSCIWQLHRHNLLFVLKYSIYTLNVGPHLYLISFVSASAFKDKIVDYTNICFREALN